MMESKLVMKSVAQSLDSSQQFNEDTALVFF